MMKTRISSTARPYTAMPTRADLQASASDASQNVAELQLESLTAPKRCSK